ncbi:MAG TPA: type IX secretion system membrane protein PorP/SprF [Chryseolinea sp.]|nr:type IX secretion system membrane protein PorP/SprF [Chryseolinea sp.]
MKVSLFLLLSVGFLALCATKVHGQQDPMYSQYMFNGLAVNPAYAGTRETLTMTALYRKQWVGISGAPTTITFSADAPIRNQKMALGIILVQDKIGISKNMLINVAYAYRIRFSNQGVLSMGLQGGINQYRANYGDVETSLTPGLADNAFGKSTSSMFPNFGFGAYYYTSKFFVGGGVPKMIKHNLSGTDTPTIDFTSYPNRQNRHLFVTTGYTFELNPDWSLKPSLLLKGVHGAPLQLDINANMWWKEKVAAGLSYRTSNAVVAMLQFQVKDEMQFGYAYDMTMSKFSGANAGSHEIMLRYEPFAKTLKKTQARSLAKKTAYNKIRKNNYRKRPSYKRKPRSR